MSTLVGRSLRLIFGLFLYALGIVLTINANIGYAPWDVFHVGLSRSTGVSIGTASILVGVFIVLLVAVFKEKIGLGTLLNMVLIGVFIDLIFFLNFVPRSRYFALGLAEMLLGLFVIALATFFYIGSGFGAGPRDSLMVLLTRRLKLPVGLIRTLLEVTVTFLGWLLGGKAGIGTIVASVAIGFCIQLSFAILKFDPTKIRHDSLAETFAAARGK